MATQVVELDECCGENGVDNPKQRLLRPRRERKVYGLQAIKNPIPEEVEDAGELKRVFQKWNLVPYAGTTKESGQSLLAWYMMLAKLSPTHNACITKKLTYAFGGKAMFTRALDADWQTDEENKPLTLTEQTAYRDALKEFFEFEGGVQLFHNRLGKSLEENGNAFVEMTFAETLGVGRVHLKTHKVSCCLYVNTQPGEMRVVAISPVWTDAYLKKREPRNVPLFPNFETMPDGTIKTMFHLKNGENKWYGRPESEGSDVYKYREVQDSLYLTRQANANFTGQLIIEVEDGDLGTNVIDDHASQQKGFADFAQEFEQNYTNKADDPQSAMIVNRPYGAKPMFVFQVSPNTNEAWYKVTGEIAETKIVRSHKCTLRFMSFDVSNGFSNDAFMSDYIINMEPVINALRDTVTGFVNKIVSVGWALLGKEGFDQYSITFAPPIQSAVEDFKTRNTAQTAQQ